MEQLPQGVTSIPLLDQWGREKTAKGNSFY